MPEHATIHASESADAAIDGTPVLLWDFAIRWRISYNALYLAGRRGRIPMWRDDHGRIYTTREAAERWYAKRALQPAPDDADPPLPIREAASVAGVSRSTVSRGVSRGLIPWQPSTGGIRLVRVSDVRSYLKRTALPPPSMQEDIRSHSTDGTDHSGERDSITAPGPLERRRVLVHLLRDLGGRISEQTDLLAYDLAHSDYTAIHSRAEQIRLLSDTVEEVRIILSEQE